MVGAIVKSTLMELPIINRFSLAKLLDELEIMTTDKDSDVADYVKLLLSEVLNYPDLRSGIENEQLMQTYKTPIEKVLRFIFPDALTHNEIKSVVMPFSVDPIYSSSRFKQILKSAGPGFKMEMKEMDENTMYLTCCLTILNKYYNYPVDTRTPFLVEIPNLELDIVKTYRIAFNADFMEILPGKGFRDVTKSDYIELMNNFNDIALWKSKFPVNSWIIKGFGVVNLMDVTTDQSIAGITYNLLNKTEQSWEGLRQNIRILLNIPDLEGSFVGYDQHTFTQAPDALECSFMLEEDETIAADELLCDYSRNLVLTMKCPLAISDVDQFYKRSKSKMSANLKKKKIKSYLLIPVLHQEKFLGFLEFASFKKHQLNAASLTKLKPILPILSMAVNRFKEEEKNQIEAIIQQKYTTIHPSVKWKFEEIAKRYLSNQQQQKQLQLDDIVFKDVYPLYGQLDIRQSSTKRNEAVTNDLLKQLKEVMRVLNKAAKENKLPIYDELIFRIQTYEKEIEDGVLAGSEQKILHLLRSDIYPLFEHLRKQQPQLEKAIVHFENLLDPELEMIYEERKNFDNSVTATNQLLASFLDSKQEEAQRMFPHYFERYKTDGVEYNLYIGQSLLKKEIFDPIYLRNLRLWQLLVTCEMEREFKLLQNKLSSPLEIASLILVYSSSLSVNFRMDEKRFDVNGAYNARYEIVKKRVDKAQIKGSNERLTQPGRIAVVYSSDQDAADYKRYFKFLMAKDYLRNEEIEDVELEDLQGITGLKALRVAVNYDQAKIQSTWNIESMLKEIEIQTS
jgi:hypothetical protein